MCPLVVDKHVWGGSETYDDWFSTHISGSDVTVTRRDANAGWGLQLKMTCCANKLACAGEAFFITSHQYLQLTDNKDGSVGLSGKTFSDGSRCVASGTKYKCGEAGCGTSHACASNSGLNGCACAKAFDAGWVLALQPSGHYCIKSMSGTFLAVGGSSPRISFRESTSGLKKCLPRGTCRPVPGHERT